MAGTDFSQKADKDFRMSLAVIIDEITVVRKQADPAARDSAAQLRNKIAALKAKVAAATLNITADQKTDLLAHTDALNTMDAACVAFMAACKTFSAKATWDGSE